MTTNATAIAAEFEKIVEDVFDHSAKDMRRLMEQLMANKELASLFTSGKTVSIGEKPHNSNSNTTRKPRTAHQPKADDVRCQGLAWNLEKDPETGELKPKRCTRGCEPDSKFCKQHGLPDGKKCAGCSAYYGEDTIHDFKYEHMGTIHDPSYIFDKYHADVLKIY